MSEEVKEPENAFEIESVGRSAEAEKPTEEKQNDNEAEKEADENNSEAEKEAEVGTESQPKKKNRAKERIERLAREKRELAKRVQELEEAKESKQELDPDDFEDYDSYLDAMLKQDEAEEPKKQAQVNDDFQEVLDSIEVKFDETRDKYEDFDELVSKQPADGGPHITPSMVEAMNEIDNSGEVAYFLAKNVNESIRISELSTIKQVMAIDKLSSQIKKENVAPKKEVKTTKAPEPINAIGGGEIPNTTIESAKSFADYEQIRKQQTRKEW